MSEPIAFDHSLTHRLALDDGCGSTIDNRGPASSGGRTGHEQRDDETERAYSHQDPTDGVDVEAVGLRVHRKGHDCASREQDQACSDSSDASHLCLLNLVEGSPEGAAPNLSRVTSPEQTRRGDLRQKNRAAP